MDNAHKNIHVDIKQILSDWTEVCNNKNLLENEDFLDKMHSHILTLESHSHQLKKYAHIQHLIDHILHTPGGAPIVSNKTLFDCAMEYTGKDIKNSSFYQYLEKSLAASTKDTNFLFNSLAILDEKLESAA